MLQNVSNDSLMNPEFCAKYVKYLIQFKKQYLAFRLSLDRIASKGFYRKHKIAFDKCVQICQKYNIDIQKYITFYVNVLDKYEKDIDDSFIHIHAIELYCDWLKNNRRLEKIYEYFMRSANTIADECISLGYLSSKDFIRHLISEKKLAEYYVSGKISLYYFAAISNFKKIIPKLDQFAKDEFQTIYDRFEMYNSDITKAYLKATNRKVNPIQITDDIIFNKRHN